jgi:hypothetical protein
MSHKAQLAHTMPGRIRIKIPTARGNLGLLEQTRQVFEGLPGLKFITLKPDSGSILLHYDVEAAAAFEAALSAAWDSVRPKTHAARKPVRPEIHNEFEDATRNIAAEAELLASRSHLARMLVDGFKDLDRHLKLATNNTLDLKIVLALGLAVVTFLGVGASAATPMWVTLVLFSLNHFLEIHPPKEASGRVQGVGLSGSAVAA